MRFQKIICICNTTVVPKKLERSLFCLSKHNILLLLHRLNSTIRNKAIKV